MSTKALEKIKSGIKDVASGKFRVWTKAEIDKINEKSAALSKRLIERLK